MAPTAYNRAPFPRSSTRDRESWLYAALMVDEEDRYGPLLVADACRRAHPDPRAPRIGPGAGTFRDARGALGSACGANHVCRDGHARADLVRSSRDPRGDHALPDALRAPRRAREADARQRVGAEPGRIVDGVEGRARLRVRAAQRRALSQRRSTDRRRREVF